MRALWMALRRSVRLKDGLIISLVTAMLLLLIIGQLVWSQEEPSFLERRVPVPGNSLRYWVLPDVQGVNVLGFQASQSIRFFESLFSSGLGTLKALIGFCPPNGTHFIAGCVAAAAFAIRTGGPIYISTDHGIEAHLIIPADQGGEVIQSGLAFASLGTPINGALVYCPDCTVANPCAGGGTGAFAKRLNGVWVCN